LNRIAQARKVSRIHHAYYLPNKLGFFFTTLESFHWKSSHKDTIQYVATCCAIHLQYLSSNLKLLNNIPIFIQPTFQRCAWVFHNLGKIVCSEKWKIHTKKVQFSDNKFNISLCLLLVWFPAPSNTFPSFPNSRDLLDPLHYNCGKNFLLLVWKCGFRENEILRIHGTKCWFWILDLQRGIKRMYSISSRLFTFLTTLKEKSILRIRIV
jgi:hypothetical protein